MKLITFAEDQGDHIGALDSFGGFVIDLTAASDGDPRFASMLALIEAGPDALMAARALLTDAAPASIHPLANVTFKAPLPRPVRLRDSSLFIAHLQPAFRGLARKLAADAKDPEAEYERLVATGKFDRPAVFEDTVIYYNSDHTAVSGPDDVIVAPLETNQLDYELEYAAIVGRTGKDVPEEEAGSYIFGYTIFNDWSARDLQNISMSSQLGPARGKDFDGANTLGPCIVTADELTDPYNLEMSARVNGEQWSQGSTSTIHHRFEKAIAHLSQNRTVYAGDVIGSGTVLSGSPIEIGKRLSNGDVVELEVEGIGVLRNRVNLPY